MSSVIFITVIPFDSTHDVRVLRFDLRNAHVYTVDMYSRERGFTIVELLIVIVVIAILAAISLVAYSGFQNRASDAAVTSDLSNLARQFNLFKVDDGSYPDTIADLTRIKSTVTKSAYDTSSTSPYNVVVCYGNEAQDFSVVSISKSGKRFYITNTSAISEYTASSNWTHSTSYITMCTNTLAGSTFISGGAGYANGDWRPWTND